MKKRHLAPLAIPLVMAYCTPAQAQEEDSDLWKKVSIYYEDEDGKQYIIEPGKWYPSICFEPTDPKHQSAVIISIDGNTNTPALAQTQTLTMECTNKTIQYWVENQDGNVSETFILEGIYIDPIAPSINGFYMPGGDKIGHNQELYTTGIAIHVDKNDELSNLSNVYYILDGEHGTCQPGQTIPVQGLGRHSIEAYATDEAGNVSEPENIDFVITENPNCAKILFLYNDVAFVNNSQGLYANNQYQWYLDGNPLDMATRQYLQLPNLLSDIQNGTHSISATATTTSGAAVESCQLRDLSIAQAAAAQHATAKVYPNPAAAHQTINIELSNISQAALVNTSITIFSSNGTLIETIRNCKPVNTISLPSGIYSGAINTDGQNIQTKIVVK